MIFISSLNYAGLCNRLNTFISDLMLYDEVYISYDKRFWWPVINDNFSDILISPKDAIIEKTIDKTKFKIDSKVCDKPDYIRNPNGFVILKSELDKLKNVKSYYSKFDGTLCYTYDRTPQYFIDKYKQYISKIEPTKEITDIVTKYWDSVGLNENVVGVHIRQGDFEKHKERRVDINRFISKMKEIKSKNDKTVFYISTDNQKLIPQFEKIFSKESVLTYIHKQDTKVHSDFKTAFICLLILSKPKHLILTNFSTYSQLAWWLGGCEAKVDIITNEYQDNYHLQ